MKKAGLQIKISHPKSIGAKVKNPRSYKGYATKDSCRLSATTKHDSKNRQRNFYICQKGNSILSAIIQRTKYFLKWVTVVKKQIRAVGNHYKQTNNFTKKEDNNPL
jgi:hypothetical protein